MTVRTSVCIRSFVPSTRDVRIEIRLKPRENRAWRAAARRSDLTLSEWLRQLGNAASTPPPPVVPPTISGDQLPLPKVK